MCSKISLEQRALQFIGEHRLVTSGYKLVVAVSGGQDSVCLLHVLLGLRKELGISLHVAHLDHRLRGAESEEDARYVSGLAKRLGIPCTVEQRDVKAYQAEHRLSLEEAAREVRYSFFAEVADVVGADSVAVGHTVDDHIETILLHIIRGTGTRGLTGLQPCSRWQSARGGVNIVRPLLSVTRQETEAYCHEHHLVPRTDSSNLELSLLRNRVRHELLPLLRNYNPGVAEALLRAARIVSDDLAFIEEGVGKLWSEAASEQGNKIILDRERFGKLHPAAKRHILRRAIGTLLGTLKDIEARHIEEIMAALDKPAGKMLSLPQGLIFSIEYARYLLGFDPATLSPFTPLEGEFPLNMPGETEIPGWQIEARIMESSQIKETVIPDARFSALFDFGRTGDKLIVRTRKPGDRFQPLGMSQPKKLNEFMIDARIPHAWRDRIPVVCSSDQILWLVGWRIDERVKVTENTRNVLRLTMRRL